MKAEMPVKQYNTLKASPNKDDTAILELYVKGLGDGIMWSNIEVKVDGKPFYCPPAKLVPTTENYMDILNRQISKAAGILTQAKLEEMPVVLLLIRGLKETFPCEGK